VSSVDKMPEDASCWIEPVPAGSKVDLLLTKTESISNSGDNIFKWG